MNIYSKIWILAYFAVPMLLLPISHASAQEPESLRIYGSKYREAARLYELAMEQMEGQHYQKAADLFSKALYHQSDLVEAYHQRALAKEHLNDPEGAFIDYKIVLLLDSTYFEAAFNRAKLRYGQQQFNRALSEFQEILRMPRGETRAVYFKGTPLNSQGQPAVNAITTGYHLHADIYNYLGLTYHALQQFDSALSAFDEALRLQPADANYYVNRGLSKLAVHRSQEAVQDFKQALTIDPSHAVAEFNLTQELESSGELDIEVYDEIIENHPDFASPLVNRAIAKLNAGDLEGALNDYDQAIALDPDNPDILLNRALAREKAQDLRGALKDFNNALRLDPLLVTAYRSRGRVLSALEEYQLAVDDFTQAIKLNTNDAAAYFNRGLVYRKMGLFEESCADLELAKKFNLAIASKALSSYCKDPNN